MSFFHRRCKHCGQSPELKVAPQIAGHAGTTDVEFTNFPYRSCSCGRLAKWAFDPGLEFSSQLFDSDSGVPTASGGRGAPRCRGCGGSLAQLEPVTLHATANLRDFAPIGMTVRLPGYRCTSCGLEQAPPDEFSAAGVYTSVARTSDGGKALDAAVRSLGLDPP